LVVGVVVVVLVVVMVVVVVVMVIVVVVVVVAGGNGDRRKHIHTHFFTDLRTYHFFASMSITKFHHENLTKVF